MYYCNLEGKKKKTNYISKIYVYSDLPVAVDIGIYCDADANMAELRDLLGFGEINRERLSNVLETLAYGLAISLRRRCDLFQGLRSAAARRARRSVAAQQEAFAREHLGYGVVALNRRRGPTNYQGHKHHRHQPLEAAFHRLLRLE